jgi:hypothetical protein
MFDPRQKRKDFLCSLCVQTGSGARPGVLSPRVKRGRGVTLTAHPNLVPRSRMSRSYTPLPQKRLLACSGTALVKYFWNTLYKTKNDRRTFELAVFLVVPPLIYLRKNNLENRKMLRYVALFRLWYCVSEMFNKNVKVFALRSWIYYEALTTERFICIFFVI